MYGDGATTRDGFIGVGEMWGNFFGYICLKQALGSASLGGNTFWFKPRILDRLNWKYGFTPEQIYYCLSGDVNNHEKLKNKLIGRYGKENDIKEAFANDGF
jgi:hypothetical protein